MHDISGMIHRLVADEGQWYEPGTIVMVVERRTRPVSFHLVEDPLGEYVVMNCQHETMFVPDKLLSVQVQRVKP